MTDFRKTDYLRQGDPRQREIHALLEAHGIMQHLAAHQPVLTGTFPIGIPIEGSDLDIACCWTSREALENDGHKYFSGYPEYRVKNSRMRGRDTLLLRFQLESYPVEIFGQDRPVEEQESYRHMLIEHRILQARSEEFREEILQLKRNGLSTEAAFCQLLGLEGDPYLVLLDYGS